MKRKQTVILNLFVVFLFLETAAITAQASWDEEVDIPDSIPAGGPSSLEYVLARRELDFWSKKIYDVGFSIKLLQRRDGDPHWWHFQGTVVTNYPDEISETDVLSLHEEWSGTTYTGFALVTATTFIKSPFKTMKLSGQTSRDSGSGREISRTFYGRHGKILHDVDSLLVQDALFGAVVQPATLDDDGKGTE